MKNKRSDENTISVKKSIFITGAGSGIGRATALHFATRNWFVGLFDIDEGHLSELAEKIGTGRCCYRRMDVTRPAEVAAAVALFRARAGGRMDVLFNCAGVLRMGPHYQIDLDDQQKIVSVNFGGILNCIQTCFELLQETPRAHVVNMSSASAVYGTPELAVYSATKHAVGGLTEALNIEFEPHDIQVCDVLAPYVQTPLIADSKVKATSVKKLGIHLQPEDVALMVWQAVHGRRVHWYVSASLKLLVLISWAFPFARRQLVKLLTFSTALPLAGKSR